MTRILIVEDNVKIQAHMVSLLRDEGYEAHGVNAAEHAEIRLDDPNAIPPDLLLLDIRLGGKSGLDLIHERGANALPPTIVISGEARISEALEALRLGVQDFIEKPFSDERLLTSIRNCLEKEALQRKVRELEAGRGRGYTMLGESAAIRDIKRQLAKVAPTMGRILIRGESGTGKELVAGALHQLSNRADKPFVKINCAAIPVHLIEDELFGHVKGAFTDARGNKMGLFEEADGGTLFLDEIGDMDILLQARLLRVLEDGMVRRIGDSRERKVDVRVVAATNKDLETMITTHKFREDLYYRLAGLPITLPPLRERTADIPLLAAYFVTGLCREYQMRPKSIDPPVFEQLKRYGWPGNIRELKNVCERLVIFGGDPISMDDVPSHLFSEDDTPVESGMVRISQLKPMPLKVFKNLCEKEYLETLLHRNNWNYVAVAKQLDINRSYLHQKITSLGIERRKR